MMTRPLPPRRRAGFTLIELLVVISIIALLVGILLPALGAARRTATRIKCLSQMRQQGIARQAYATDNNDNMIVGSVTIGYDGVANVKRYSSSRNLGLDRLSWYIRDLVGNITNDGLLYEGGYSESLDGFFCPEPPVQPINSVGSDYRQVLADDTILGKDNWDNTAPPYAIGLGTYQSRPDYLSITDQHIFTKAKNIKGEIYVASLFLNDNNTRAITWCPYFDDLYYNASGVTPERAHNNDGQNVIYGDGSGDYLQYATINDHTLTRTTSTWNSWLDSHGTDLGLYENQ